MIGTRFGRLTIIDRHGSNKHGKALWRCLCDCGSENIVSSNHLMSGNTKSCGCLRRDTLKSMNTTHGMRESITYTSWYGMKSRCTNINNKSYARRGICICDRWMDFNLFLEDMGERPSLLHSIDRIDTTLGYTKENCRWATKLEQGNNRRDNIRVKCLEGI